MFGFQVEKIKVDLKSNSNKDPMMFEPKRIQKMNIKNCNSSKKNYFPWFKLIFFVIICLNQFSNCNDFCLDEITLGSDNCDAYLNASISGNQFHMNPNGKRWVKQGGQVIYQNVLDLRNGFTIHAEYYLTNNSDGSYFQNGIPIDGLTLVFGKDKSTLFSNQTDRHAFITGAQNIFAVKIDYYYNDETDNVVKDPATYIVTLFKCLTGVCNQSYVEYKKLTNFSTTQDMELKFDATYNKTSQNMEIELVEYFNGTEKQTFTFTITDKLKDIWGNNAYLGFGTTCAYSIDIYLRNTNICYLDYITSIVVTKASQTNSVTEFSPSDSKRVYMCFNSEEYAQRTDLNLVVSNGGTVGTITQDTSSTLCSYADLQNCDTIGSYTVTFTDSNKAINREFSVTCPSDLYKIEFVNSTLIQTYSEYSFKVFYEGTRTKKDYLLEEFSSSSYYYLQFKIYDQCGNVITNPSIPTYSYDSYFMSMTKDSSSFSSYSISNKGSGLFQIAIQVYSAGKYIMKSDYFRIDDYNNQYGIVVSDYSISSSSYCKILENYDTSKIVKYGCVLYHSSDYITQTTYESIYQYEIDLKMTVSSTNTSYNVELSNASFSSNYYIGEYTKEYIGTFLFIGSQKTKSKSTYSTIQPKYTNGNRFTVSDCWKMGYIYLITSENKCSDTCSKYYYEDEDNTTRKYCVDSCPEDYKYLVDGTNQCVKACSPISKFISEDGTKCVSPCPHYKNVEESLCLTSCHSKYVIDESQKKCTNCKNLYKYKATANECIDEPSNGYNTLNSSFNYIEICYSLCASCTYVGDNSNNKCSSCISGYYLLEESGLSNCISSCGDKYYQSSYEGKCINCKNSSQYKITNQNSCVSLSQLILISMTTLKIM